MNKKTLLTSLLFACISLGAFAQTQRGGQTPYVPAPSRNEYLIKEPLWYLSIGAGAQMYNGEDDGKSPFNSRLTLAPTLTIGRRVSNWVNLRLQLTGGSLHGFNDGWAGIYTRWNDKKFYRPDLLTLDPSWEYRGWTQGAVGSTPNPATGANMYVKDGDIYRLNYAENEYLYMQHLRYIGGYFDVSFNILNLFTGYQPMRRIEVSPFGGVGFFQRFAHQGNLAGSFVGASVGMNISYRIHDNWAVYTEGRGTVVSDGFDGQKGSMNNNSMFSWTAGLTYRFGNPRYIDPDIDKRLSQPYNITRIEDQICCGIKRGMVLVPGGNIQIGGGVDPVWGDTISSQIATVSPFWMDETEVTNEQYREFVCWVRDYVIRQRLADSGDPSYLSWNKDIPWEKPNPMEASVISSVVGGLYPSDRSGIEGLNASLINYKYEWFDSKSYYSSRSMLNSNRSITVSKDTAYIDNNGEIIRRTITRQSTGNPIDFTNTYIVNVYPNVLSWVEDFPNSKNEQYARYYYSKPAFDKFPVVGVSYEQAEAYCAWRTQRYLESGNKKEGFEPYRLPTEAEWEFAARNGNSWDTNPWYSSSNSTSDGLSRMNYRGSENYKELLSPVATFLPNRFGLYDMAGNVAEWTTSTYVPAKNMNTDLANPDYSYRANYSDPDELKRKLVKGGSWKDVSPFTRSTEKAFEYQYKGRSYIGFRCVRSWGIDNKGRMK